MYGAIHHPVGDRCCSGEDRICNWRPFKACQKAACGVIAHSIVLSGAESKAQLALFVSVKVAVLSFCWEIFLVCESTANQALAQARPIDALHLTSRYDCSCTCTHVHVHMYMCTCTCTHVHMYMYAVIVYRTAYFLQGYHTCTAVCSLVPRHWSDQYLLTVC